jgi:hypothetical protein
VHDDLSIAALRERFSEFYDALLVELHLHLPRSARDRRALVRLVAQDCDGTWCSVAFAIEGLREFAISEGRTSSLVLSDGLGMHRVDGGVFLDLAPFTDQPVAPAQLRRSHAYVFGDSCVVEVSEAVE